MQPGMSVSFVARRAGIAPSQLFAWKRRMIEGGHAAVQADEDVVGTSRLRELEKRVRDLERLLGRKTMENEILKEAIEVARLKKPTSPQGTVGNLVCGAIVKPQEAGYGDQEGHVGRAFVGARSEGGVFQGWAFRRAEESAGRARLERGTGRPSRWPGGGGQGQSPQWLFEEDGADPECQAGLAYSARSGRHVRPEADRPVSAAVSGLRREDRLHVRARHDDPGDPGSSNGDLWARRVARPNLDSDRRSPGGRGRMAESAARADVSDRLL